MPRRARQGSAAPRCFFSLQVLKNLTNIFTLAGDYYFYGRSYNWGVWGCMVLMIMSALCGAATDLTFDLRGYFWQVCVWVGGGEG